MLKYDISYLPYIGSDVSDAGLWLIAFDAKIRAQSFSLIERIDIKIC